MLENLNDKLCVSRLSGKDNDMWICYEPSTICPRAKRQKWKRLTGLMSGQEMERYLDKNFPCSEIKKNYESISARLNEGAQSRAVLVATPSQ